MKKQVKFTTTIIMIIVLIFSIANIVSAAPVRGTDGAGGGGPSSGGGAASSALDTMKQGLQGGMTSGGTAVAGLGKSIVGIMQVVGVVVAVVVILVIGIKYLIGSAEERAEYKKTMIPYLVGAILIFAATTIVNVVYNLASSIQVE